MTAKTYKPAHGGRKGLVVLCEIGHGANAPVPLIPGFVATIRQERLQRSFERRLFDWELFKASCAESNRGQVFHGGPC